MEKEYKFNLTDEELMHILVACDAWCSEQKKKAYKAHLIKKDDADEYEKRYTLAVKLMEKLVLSIAEQNSEFDMREMWKKVMFDI